MLRPGRPRAIIPAMPKKSKINMARFNQEAETIRTDYLQPAIENANKTLQPYTLAILHAIFTSAYSTSLILTDGDPERAGGLFTDTAKLALESAQGSIDPTSYKK
jgi:hypothetical protein